MLYGRISVGYEYANGLQAMLKPALYKKRKRIAMYAAASAPFLSKTALVMVIPMLEQIMAKRETSHKERRPMRSARHAPAIDTKKFQICMPPLVPVCWFVLVTLMK